MSHFGPLPLFPSASVTVASNGKAGAEPGKQRGSIDDGTPHGHLHINVPSPTN